MFDQSYPCSYNFSLAQRLLSLSITNETINEKILYDGLANLIPTHPKVFENLSQRREFRVLFLTQGDYRQSLSKDYESFGQEMIFLSYKTKSAGILML